MSLEPAHTQIELLCQDYTTEDGESYTGYGLAVYSVPEHQPLFAAADLSPSRQDVQALIRMLQENDVSAVHFADIVDDFLT